MKIDNDKEFESLKEAKVKSEKIFEGQVISLYKDTVKVPGGKLATRELVRHNGAVCMIPVTEDGKIVVERQFRYPSNSVLTEIPAGKLDSVDEDRLEAAKRELREETGLIADTWIDLGIYYPTVAYADEEINMYLCSGFTKTERNLDEDEFIDVYEVPIEELVKDVMAGKITDGKTQVGILKAYYYLNGQNGE